MAIAKEISNQFTPGQNNHLLNAWQRIMGASIWHWNQAIGKNAPLETAYDKAGQAYLQFEREMIARFMEQALIKVAHELNYWPLPAWFSDVQFIGKGKPIQNQTFRTRWPKLIALGQRAQSLIEAGSAVVYSDPYTLGLNTQAAVSVVTTIDASEVKAFFTINDGLFTPAGDVRFEIEPLEALSIAGTVALTGHASQFISPLLVWYKPYVTTDPNLNRPNQVDTTDAANFVTTVDLYRVYNDTSVGIEVLAGDGTVLQTYTGEILDPDNGIVRIGNLCDTLCYTKTPYTVKIFYYAGLPLVNGFMDNEMLEAITMLANADMNNKLTGFSSWILNQWENHRRPMIENVGNGSISLLSPGEANNPFGLRTGQVQAWRSVSDRAYMKAGKLTQGWKW